MNQAVSETCPHVATVTGAIAVTDQRMCQREAEVWWRRDLSAPTVCVTCGKTPEPEESR